MTTTGPPDVVRCVRRPLARSPHIDTPPDTLLDPLSADDRSVVGRWWAALSATAREELAGLYDERHDTSVFGPAVDADPPTVIGGRFLPTDDAWRVADWETDWREYLVEHPGDYRGDHWGPGSVVIAAQYRSFSLLDGSYRGIRCIVVNWDATTFPLDERPPSGRLPGRR